MVGAEQWSRGSSFWGPCDGCMSSYGSLVVVMRVFVFCGWRVVRVKGKKKKREREEEKEKKDNP